MSPPGRADLPLRDFQPVSSLHVAETPIERPRFPVIDVHTHLTDAVRAVKGVPMGESRAVLAPPSALLSVMDRRGIQTMVNLTGGWDAGLRASVDLFDRAHPGRFVTFTEPSWERVPESSYPRWQAEAIERAHRDGARGVKVLKTLGLYLRQRVTDGTLVTVDDARFDPLWETCAGLRMPVAIHVGDPEAFFRPIDRYNERYEELANHPDWSFHGRDYPSQRALLDALDRVIGRHPRTEFIGLHVGNAAEDLGFVSASLDRHPNLSVELGARIGELGRQPRASARFFDRHQDRILFGTDATPNAPDVPQQTFGDALYRIYFRFLETADEYFDYAPAAVPPQGRWRIYGLGLDEGVLRKVYHDNAARLLGL